MYMWAYMLKEIFLPALQIHETIGKPRYGFIGERKTIDLQAKIFNTINSEKTFEQIE